MYGMVNQGIEDLVVSVAGQETWETIKAEAAVDVVHFSESATYDDAITYNLVAAASKVLNLPAEQILEDFGRHWILYTGRQGWGSLFQVAGDDLETFLSELDNLHARVQVAMPDIRMPCFSCERNADGTLTVEYRSEREGLSPMVTGLLSGLIEYFNEPWTIRHTGKRVDQGFDTFTLDPAVSLGKDSSEANAA